MFFGALILIISLLAGMYPALVMSSYRPAVALSGKKISAGRAGFSLRKSLIVLQFSASLFFIIATLVIGSQMDFIRKTDRGFSTSNVITFRTNWEGEVSKVQTLVDRLRNVRGLEDVSMQGFPPWALHNGRLTPNSTEKMEPVKILTAIKSGDDHYIPLYKLRLIAGRNIILQDTVREVVVNETFAKALGFDDPRDAIGERFTLFTAGCSLSWASSRIFTRSLSETRSVIVSWATSKTCSMKLLFVWSNPDILANTSSHRPDYNLNLNKFIQTKHSTTISSKDEIGWLHGEEQKTSKLATISMGITIFISCMGVFGLAMFTANMRIKEIGIRKVLGATSLSIVNMLGREFMILIIVSIVIATPVALVLHERLAAWIHVSNTPQLVVLRRRGAHCTAHGPCDCQRPIAKSSGQRPCKNLKSRIKKGPQHVSFSSKSAC